MDGPIDGRIGGRSNLLSIFDVLFFFFSLFRLSAFPSYDSFKCFIEENEKKKAKRCSLLMTPRVLTALIRNNDGLHHEDLRISHLDHLKTYIELTGQRTEATASQTTCSENASVLRTIRANCLSSASLRLASEQGLKTKSLGAYSRQSKFQTRHFLPKNLNKTLKLVQSNRTEFDLLDTKLLDKESVSLSFSCMLCPVLALDQEPTKRKKNLMDEDVDKNDQNNLNFQDHDAYNTDSDNDDDALTVNEDGKDTSARPKQSRRNVCFVDPLIAQFNIYR